MITALSEVGMVRGRKAWGRPKLTKNKSHQAAERYMRNQLRNLRGARGFAFVAELDGSPAGFVSAEVHRYGVRNEGPFASGEIQELLVRRASRRRGVATALMEDMERELRRRGFANVTLYTDQTFRPAYAFYRQRGYSVRTLRFAKDLR